MDTEEIIRKKYSNLAVSEKAGELLFRQPDALTIIDECERLGAVVIGMNFWKWKGDGYMEVNSTDYSSINTLPDATKETIDAARELIKDKLPDNADCVSFVL